MRPLTYEEGLVLLAEKTGLDVMEWADFLSCTPTQQRAIVTAYANQNWVRDRNVLADVLDILGVIGTVAGAISGVTGAASAIAALKSL